MIIITIAASRQLSASQDAKPLSSYDDLAAFALSCNNRTTLSIVWSCLATIFACTWIAIHPNLPFKGERLFVRRIKIFAIALICPELIIVWAIRQWVSSRDLAHEYKDYGWTKTHGFFAIMGGFQTCGADGKSFCTLKPEELEPYVKDHIITVSETEILDRSKGDFLSKFLVLLQVSWFILQVLARAIQHLAITEIELVTLSYAILNFIIYFCWWNKPLDVHSPITINKRFGPISASSSVTFSPSDQATASGIILEGNSGHIHTSLFSGKSTTSDLSTQNHYDLENNSHHGVVFPPALTRGVPLVTTSRMQTSLKPHLAQTPVIPDRDLARQRPIVQDIELSPLLPVRRNFGNHDQALSTSTETAAEKPTAKYQFKVLHALISGEYSEDSPYACGPSTDSRQIISIRLVMVIATIFGIPHCLGWDFEFPTKAEERLWRTLSIAITSAPILALLIGHVSIRINWMSGWADSQLCHSNHINKIPLRTLKVVLSILKLMIYICTAVIVCYPIANIILLIQMFVVLRKPDPGIYTPVDWVTYVPHF